MKNDDKEKLLKARQNCKKYREKHLDKDKKFFSVRFSMEEGTEIKEFIKEYDIPIKQIIERGTEIMWKEKNNGNIKNN